MIEWEDIKERCTEMQERWKKLPNEEGKDVIEGEGKGGQLSLMGEGYWKIKLLWPLWMHTPAFLTSDLVKANMKPRFWFKVSCNWLTPSVVTSLIK